MKGNTVHRNRDSSSIDPVYPCFQWVRAHTFSVYDVHQVTCNCGLDFYLSSHPRLPFDSSRISLFNHVFTSGEYGLFGDVDKGSHVTCLLRYRYRFWEFRLLFFLSVPQRRKSIYTKCASLGNQKEHAGWVKLMESIAARGGGKEVENRKGGGEKKI